MQQADVAELMRRAEKAEHESAAARAEALAARKAAEQERIDRAIAEYTQATSMQPLMQDLNLAEYHLPQPTQSAQRYVD